MRDVLRVFVNKQLSGNLQHFLFLFIIFVLVQMHWFCIVSVRGCVCCLLWFVVSIYTRGSPCFHKVKSFRNCFLSSFANFVLLLNGSKGSVVGHWVKAVQPVRFMQGNNDLLLLTQTVGLQVIISTT